MNVYKMKYSRSDVKSVSAITKFTNFPYKENPENVMLRDWLNEKWGRGKALSHRLYGDETIGVSHYKSGLYPVFKEDVPRLRAAMQIVEMCERG